MKVQSLEARLCRAEPAPIRKRGSQEKARRSGGSVATGLLLVLTAECKARNAPRFASPSGKEGTGSLVSFQ